MLYHKVFAKCVVSSKRGIYICVSEQFCNQSSFFAYVCKLCPPVFLVILSLSFLFVVEFIEGGCIIFVVRHDLAYSVCFTFSGEPAIIPYVSPSPSNRHSSRAFGDVVWCVSLCHLYRSSVFWGTLFGESLCLLRLSFLCLFRKRRVVCVTYIFPVIFGGRCTEQDFLTYLVGQFQDIFILMT